MSTLTIRVDDATKTAASEVAQYYGLDLSSVTRAFWRQMARTRSIPLVFSPEEPNDESLESVRQADELIAAGGSGTGLKTARDLLNAARE